MLVESFNRTRWLDKLRPAGASQKAEGPEGPMAPIVTTGCHHDSKKKLDYISRFAHILSMLFLSVSFQ